jgi:O-antigen/teichoic acid export membrane protein
MKNLFDTALANAGFRRYFANTSWMFGEQILRMFAGLFVGIWVARYLGPVQFGEFSYVIAFVAIFSTVAKLGLDGVVVRDLVNEPSKRDMLLGTAFWLKIFGSFATLMAIAIATIVADNNNRMNLYIFIISSGIIFQSFEVIDFYFQSKVLSKFVSICKIVQLLLSSVLKIYLVLSEADLVWFVIVSLIDQVAIAITLFISYSYQKVGNFYQNFDFITAKRILRNSWPLIITGFSIALYMRIDQIMLKEMMGMHQVGIYSAAVRISESWYFIPVLISTSLFPSIISAKKADEALYIQRLKKLFFFMAWIAIIASVITTCFSDKIISIFYGLKYQDAGNILSIHIWSGVFVAIGVVNGQWFLLQGYQKIATVNTIIGAIINIVLNYLLIPVYGVNGVAFATLISYAFSAYFLLFFNRNTRELFYQIANSILGKFKT